MKLSTNANIGDAITPDAGYLTYYRSSADNTVWAIYWSGSAWVQVQLDATAVMSSSSTSLFLPYYMTYVDSAGKLQVLYYAGKWGHVPLGDGGFNLTGGIGIQKSTYWVYARRSDGNVLFFYYQ